MSGDKWEDPLSFPLLLLIMEEEEEAAARERNMQRGVGGECTDRGAEEEEAVARGCVCGGERRGLTGEWSKAKGEGDGWRPGVW